MARTAKRYKKNTEKKVLGIPVCMAAIYARLSVDSDEKKSESIETQVTLIKEFIQKHNENLDREYEIAVYGIYLRSCLYTLGRTVKIQSGQPCYCIWFHEPSVWCTFICSGTGGDCAGIFCKQPCGTDPGMYRNLYSK